MTRTCQLPSLYEMLFKESLDGLSGGDTTNNTTSRIELLHNLTHQWLQLPGDNLDFEHLDHLVKTKLNISRVGKGGNRYVYGFDNKSVLKVAKEDLIENKQEVKALVCLEENGFSDLAPKLLDYDQETPFAWLLVEKVKPLDSNQFLQMFLSRFSLKENPNFDFDLNPKSTYEEFHEFFFDFFYSKESFQTRYDEVFVDQINASHVVSGLELYKRLERDRLIQRLSVMIDVCDFVSAGDFHSENWGIGTNGNLVILDLGYDEDNF